MRPDYGVPAETFVAAWQSSATVDEVREKLEELARRLNRDPMPGPSIVARAAEYRRAGVGLKAMAGQRADAKLDVSRLNEVVSRVNRGEQVELTGEPAAARPVIVVDPRAGAMRVQERMRKRAEGA